MSYALVQKSLEQTIDRRDLEEASVHVPSVARGDCARLHRNLFGIVVTGLSRDEAIAFQVALEYFHFPTEIVADAEIPRLPDPVVRRGIRFETAELIALDGLGRESPYPWREMQFATGGFVETSKVKHDRMLIRNPYYNSGARIPGPMFVVGKRETEAPTLQFRLELYFPREPYRLQFRADKNALFRCDDALLRFRELKSFAIILRRIAQLLPQERLGLGIRAAQKGRDFLYPNPSCLEEEVIWHILQRQRR